MTAAEVAWTLYREGPGRHDEGNRAGPRDRRPTATRSPDEVARAGTLLFAAGSYEDADAARARALACGAAPQLLAYLDTACTLRTGDGRAARAALAQHLVAAPDPLHTDMPWLAATAGAPLLAWQAARRAGLSAPRAVDLRRAGCVAPLAAASVPHRLRSLSPLRAGCGRATRGEPLSSPPTD